MERDIPMLTLPDLQPGQIVAKIARNPVEYMTMLDQLLLDQLHRTGNRVTMVQYVDGVWVITYVVGEPVEQKAGAMKQ